MRRAMRWAWVAPAIAVLAACTDAGPVGPAVEAASLSRGASGAAVAGRAANSTSGPNIVELAVQVNQATGEFSTLIAAVLSAGLADALSAPGQRTVFAPTDAAFVSLGLTAANIGTALSKEDLTNILLYHVTPGRRAATSVVNADRLRMANGGFTRIRVTSAGAFINESKIIDTDIAASNGFIHVIDHVLLP
jgi:uncharacterized surface protein with fasciclin (FAS1) repeats